MSKKVLSLVLALVMVLGSFGTVFAASFPDTDNTVYADAVDRLTLLGILTGYNDGSFKPEGEITRAEFAAVAVRAKGLESAATAAKGLATGFTDVPTTHWASGYVGTAARLGIVNGVGGGLFAPEAPVKYEEAVTMIVRALGYEPSAQAKGGYPYGYLIVANEVGLLDAVKGTQGTPALRGTVAQITDNALEIEMMIQTGFGSETKWVVSGTEGTKEKYLLDELGFDSVIGRTTNVSSSRRNITVSVEDKDEQSRLGLSNTRNTVSISVPAGFDVYGIEGVEAKIWYRDGLVIARALEEAKYDAFEYLESEDRIKLVTEDKKYRIGEEEDADFYYTIKVNDVEYDEDDFENADYAKVVLNSDDEVIWAQGYTIDGFVVVDEVDGFDITSADDYNEVDVEDFIIVKDGKEISAEDLEEGDVVYYNEDEEFAVVYNNSKTGEIERVYVSDDAVRFAGKNYTVDPEAIYLNEEGKIGELTSEILEDIQDEEEEVTVFFNFKNEVTVVLAGPEFGTSAYYALTKDANAYAGRSGDMLALDLRDSTGAKVSFDLDEDFFDDGDFKIQSGDGDATSYNGAIDATFAATLKEGHVVKISLDKDGDPTEVVQLTPFAVRNNDEIEVDDSKVTSAANGKSYRLQSGTVVFYDELKKAVRLGDVKDEFSEIENATFFVEKGNVVAIEGETDADTDTTTVSGLLDNTSVIRQLRNGKWEVRIRVSGTNKTYVTKDDKISSDPFTKYYGMVLDLEIGDKSGEIEEFAPATAIEGEVDSASGRTIRVDGTNYTLNAGYKVYTAALKEAKLSDTVGEDVVLYMDGNSARFVNYVIIDGTAPTPEEEDPSGVVTGITALGAVTTQGKNATDVVDAAPEEDAEVTILDAIELTSELGGAEGNGISIEIVEQTGEGKSLVVVVTGKAIKVGLETNVFGDTSSTIDDVIAALEDNTSGWDATGLVSVALASGADGDDLAGVVAKTSLTGGKDEVLAAPAAPAVAEEYTLTISGPATANGTITVKGADRNVDVNVVNGMSAVAVANAIKASGLSAVGYTIDADTNTATVIFTANTAGAKTTSLNITVVDK